MTVVNNIDAPKAGSTFNFCNIIGIDAPKNPATNKLNIIANAITIPNPCSPNQRAATKPTITAKTIPFIKPTINIGDRQKGKIKPSNVIDCKFSESSINQAVNLGLSRKFKKKITRVKNPYEKKINLSKILDQIIIKSQNKSFLKKKFNDCF